MELEEVLPESYSNLEHMTATPMARTILKALTKKKADIRFMCRDVCSAAVAEGSDFFQTRVLSMLSQERRFHNRLAADLPAVATISLPVQIGKKLSSRKFSP